MVLLLNMHKYFRDGGRSENLGWLVIMRRAGAATTVFRSAKTWSAPPPPIPPSLYLPHIVVFREPQNVVDIV